MSLELPNYTIIFQFLFFWATVYILNRFVFSPLLGVLKERRKRTLEAFKAAETLSKEAVSVLNRYQADMKQCRDKLRKTKEGARAVLAKEEGEQIRKLREDFVRMARKTEKNIEGQLRTSESALAVEVETLSGEIFRKFSLRENR